MRVTVVEVGFVALDSSLLAGLEPRRVPVSQPGMLLGSIAWERRTMKKAGAAEMESWKVEEQRKPCASM